MVAVAGSPPPATAPWLTFWPVNVPCPPVSPPMVGGFNSAGQFSGVLSALPAGAQVLVLSEGAAGGMHPVGAVSISEQPGNLPAQAAGETAIYHADGRILVHPRNDGTTALYSPATVPPTGTTTARGNFIEVRASGAITLYPAYGDGIHDDTANLQAALTAAGAATGGGIVSVPPGTFVVNTPAVTLTSVAGGGFAGLAIPSNVTLQGAGKYRTSIVQTFALDGFGLDSLLTNADAATTAQAGNQSIVIADLTLQTPPVQGTAPNMSAYGEAIWFMGCSDVLVTRCRVINGMMSFRPLHAQQNTPTVHKLGLNQRVAVTNCYMAYGAESVGFMQGTDFTFSHNHVYQTFDSALSINSSGERIVIANNLIDKNGSAFASLGLVELTNDEVGDAAGIRDVTVSGNVLLSNGYAGSGFGLWAFLVTNLAVTGNTIRNCANDGVRLSGPQNATISGNSVSGNANNGITLTSDLDASGLTISGNTVSGNAAAGLLLGVGGSHPCVGLVVSGNTVLSNGSAGISLSGPVALSGAQVQGNVLYGSPTAFTSSATGSYAVHANSGYASQTSGAATVQGSRSVAVSHGLAATPTRVLVTPQGNPGSAYWVSGKTASQFTINLANVGTCTFDWLAQVGESAP